MAEIFDYDDYRDMIKDYYLEHKKHNSLYSFSTLGKTLGLDSSHASMQFPPQRKCSDWTVAGPHTLTC